jgi:hypothetical protein
MINHRLLRVDCQGSSSPIRQQGDRILVTPFDKAVVPAIVRALNHARFLSAVRTLAQVRKLAVPALQVNIAKNQVNVAGAGS